MKSLEISLWVRLAIELANLCGTDAKRDIETMSRRIKEEGDSFLTITLPSYGKSFDKALEHGRILPTQFAGFRRRAGLPLFLGGFLKNIFDANGVMIDEPCIDSIIAVRQLSALCGKIKEESSLPRQRKAVRQFIEADEACLDWDLTSPESLIREMTVVSTQVMLPVLQKANHAVRNNQITPKHGPGTTSDRLLGNKKYDLKYWPDHLDSRFPWVDWAIPNYRWVDHESSFDDKWNPLPYVGTGEPGPRDPSVPAELLLVPKTASAMRVIVREPTSLQYMQQGLLKILTNAHETFWTQVGFTDQGLNRDMARHGSIYEDLATIDLSEASDRVTYLQAASVFSCVPDIWEALDATRSPEVRVLDRVYPIYKFASMGSAVCFPVEASVFIVGIYMAIKRHHRKTDPSFDLTPNFIRSMEGKVRVYGDDIVVPVEYLSAISDVFSALGWKINQNKSFGTGKFRESCGGDYWNGHNVTPVRVRYPIPTDRRQISETESYVSLRNQLYNAGFWSTVCRIDERIGTLLGGTFPIADETTSGLVRVSASFSGRCRGIDEYQRACVRAWHVSPVIPKNAASELGSLLKCLIAPGKDDEHLHHSGRPVDAYMNRRWTPVLNEELVGEQGIHPNKKGRHDVLQSLLEL
jgi:hypothetical protein